MVLFKKSELTSTSEPGEDTDLYYTTLELIEKLESNEIKVSENVRITAPKVFNVLAQVLNGGFQQAIYNADQDVTYVAESYFGAKEEPYLHIFSNLCSAALEIEIPNADNEEEEEESSLAWDALDKKFYDSDIKYKILAELKQMIEAHIIKAKSSDATAETTPTPLLDSIVEPEALPSGEALAGADPTGNGRPVPEVPASESTGVKAPVVADGGASSEDILASFVEKWTEEQLAITDGTYASWPAEVDKAAEDLQHKLEEVAHHVELNLHDGGYSS